MRQEFGASAAPVILFAMPVEQKTIHFISGMPRSGSTLLANILAQNPRFHVTPTSGLIDALIALRTSFDKSEDYKACPNENAKMGAVRGAMYGFFEPVDRPVVFDRNRAWLAELEMAEVLLGHQAKVIVCVRDMPDILASFELLWRQNKAFRKTFQQEMHVVEFQSLEGRCNVLLQPAHVVGIAYIRIQDALTRGFGDRMHFVHFDQLTANPTGTLQRIYKFLGEQAYPHDYENVQQVITENDLFHGISGLHDIRSAVRTVASRAKEVLGDLAAKYNGPYIWDPYIHR